jgi:hypothetical protein
MRHVKIVFEDKDFKKLENKKEKDSILLGKPISWEDYILKLARIRK